MKLKANDERERSKGLELNQVPIGRTPRAGAHDKFLPSRFSEKSRTEPKPA
jgi:hypothetical protein